MLDDLFKKTIRCAQLREHRKSAKKPHDDASHFEAKVIEYLENNGYDVDSTVKPVDCVATKNGHKYIVEVKYVMGWPKACEAQWEIATCYQRIAGDARGALVFFKRFNGNWGSAPKYLGRPKGWDLWYRDHADVNGLIAHLVQFDENTGPAIHPLANVEERA